MHKVSRYIEGLDDFHHMICGTEDAHTRFTLRVMHSDVFAAYDENLPGSHFEHGFKGYAYIICEEREGLESRLQVCVKRI